MLQSGRVGEDPHRLGCSLHLRLAVFRVAGDHVERHKVDDQSPIPGHKRDNHEDINGHVDR